MRTKFHRLKSNESLAFEDNEYHQDQESFENNQYQAQILMEVIRLFLELEVIQHDLCPKEKTLNKSSDILISTNKYLRQLETLGPMKEILHLLLYSVNLLPNN